jgi:adenosine deaminase CECR1
MSQSDVAKYQIKRSAFINEDRALRPDHTNPARRSATEMEADKIVRQIRAFEASSIWNGEHGHPFPGMEFLTGMVCCDMIKQFLENLYQPGMSLYRRHFSKF